MSDACADDAGEPEPHCHAQAIVRGVLYQCQRRAPHDGPHRSDDTEWGMR